MIVKSGSAVWSGGLKDGEGRVSTESGALDGQPYGFATRFEGKAGTNPEELIGAAHAACFSMALANILGGRGIVPEEIAATAKVTMEKKPDGFEITRSHLIVRIRADAEEGPLVAAAEEAKAGCPVSKLLAAEVTMEVTAG